MQFKDLTHLLLALSALPQHAAGDDDYAKCIKNTDMECDPLQTYKPRDPHNQMNAGFTITKDAIVAQFGKQRSQVLYGGKYPDEDSCVDDAAHALEGYLGGAWQVPTPVSGLSIEVWGFSNGNDLYACAFLPSRLNQWVCACTFET